MLSGCRANPDPGGSSDVGSVPLTQEDFSNTQSSPPALSAEVQGVKIALIDTGIAVKAIKKERILPGFNYVTRSADCEDRINHGTAVSSVIVGCKSAGVDGMADSAYLIPLVVTDKVNGTTQSVTPDVLAQAIRDSIDVYQADIINVSIGIQKDHPALRDAVAYAEREGVAVISAVGNGGKTGKPYYPAAYDSVLAVGSCNRNGKVSSFSQSGAAVLAAGEGIMLASRNGVPYGVKGTSFATGVVSAHAAKLLAEKPTLAPKQLYQEIIEKAVSNGGYLPLQ